MSLKVEGYAMLYVDTDLHHSMVDAWCFPEEWLTFGVASDARSGGLLTQCFTRTFIIAHLSRFGTESSAALLTQRAHMPYNAYDIIP
ncbi:MAG: hypothetical protein RMJ55_09695, partial [Roseiflexaceae bacterium]|nr:hypothetical protein [Roseiflexaceae bacterium]